MRHPSPRLTILCLASLLACGGPRKTQAPATAAPAKAEAPATPAPAPAPAPTPAPPPAAAPAPTPAPTPTPAPAPTATPPAASKASPPPAPSATTSRPSPAPAPRPAAPPPAAAPAPAPAVSAHAKVGATRCRMCHKVQFESWQASPHAARGLDCEGCHGNGADYSPMAIMRDPAKARANGLLTPTVATCKPCHPTATSALLPNAHAHKAR